MKIAAILDNFHPNYNLILMTMQKFILTDIKETCKEIFIYPETASPSRGGKFLYLVVSYRKDIEPDLILLYTKWLYKAALIYRNNKPDSLPLLQILNKLLQENGASYCFWGYEIKGCILIDNFSSKPCVESYGNLSVKQFCKQMELFYLSEKKRIKAANIIAVTDGDQDRDKDKDNEDKSQKNGGHGFTWTFGNSFNFPNINSFLSHPKVKQTANIVLLALLGALSYLLINGLLKFII